MEIQNKLVVEHALVCQWRIQDLGGGVGGRGGGGEGGRHRRGCGKGWGEAVGGFSFSKAKARACLLYEEDQYSK